MFDQNEGAEISVENELSLKAQLTASETNIKQKDKQEKFFVVYRNVWFSLIKTRIIEIYLL